MEGERAPGHAEGRAKGRAEGRAESRAERPAEGRIRKAYFGPQVGFVDTPVVEDLRTGAAPVPCPLLIDRYDTTVVVPPGCTVSAAPGGTLVIVVGTGGSHA